MSTKQELEMAAAYSETSSRVADALEKKKAGKSTGKDPDDLKKEIEMWEHKVSVEEMCERLGTSAENGMTSANAAAVLARDGPNMLTPPKQKPWWVKLGMQFLNFFAILLQVAAIISFIGYALHPESSDHLILGIVLYCVVILTALFTFFQEGKSEKTMEKFKNFLPPESLITRDGKKSKMDASVIVVGDLIDIELGDKLPADCRIIVNNKLKVDNSSLTGEAEPLSRTVECTDDNPLETKNLAFFGTLAVEGTAKGIVVNTGDRTVFGRIAGLAASAGMEETTLQIEIHHFVVIISAIAISLGVIFFVIGIIKGTGWIDNIVFCIGIIVANVPEGLLATVTVSLTLTAKRMAKKNVLVKKLECVETLGSCTTICSDKTGTLTQNRMTILHLMYNGRIETAKTTTTEQSFDFNDPTFKALFFGACNCAKAQFDQTELAEHPDRPIDERAVMGDASEAGILKWAEKLTPVMEERAKSPQVSGIPFNSTNKFMITINKDCNNPGRLILLMKGAPERIIERCSMVLENGQEREMTARDNEVIAENLQTLMEGGERVLAFAQYKLESKYDENYEFDTDNPNFPLQGLTFVGLAALLDPPRETVPYAVSTCQQAGIQVIMVTGDHPDTAKAIAKQVKIITDPTRQDLAKSRGVAVEDIDPSECRAIVVPGWEIKDLVEADWDRVLAHEQIVFARTSPQQKLIIVENCQRLDKIVAVTGDGVNDSPALKKGNIGVAMGISGSDVSKEAADMIILDDNFASIVSGVEEGRLIFDNMKKSIAYTLTSNIPEITPFISFILIGFPLPLPTILILVIDLGTDMLPAISLAYEKAESDIMLRPPRDAKKDHLVTKKLISFSYFQIGMMQAYAGFFTYFVIFNDYGMSPQILPKLDAGANFATDISEDKRYLAIRNSVPRGYSYARNWFENDGIFAKYFTSGSPLPVQTEEEEDLFSGAPGAGAGVVGAPANEQFNNMIKIIGYEYQIPPCFEYACTSGGNGTALIENDWQACFGDATSTVYYNGFNTGVKNPNVMEHQDSVPNSGCFDVWTNEMQDETLTFVHSGFLLSIVIMQFTGVMICKTRILSLFSQGMTNWVLNAGLLQETVMMIGLLYIPPIAKAFGTNHLKFVHWLPAIPWSVGEFVYDEVRKMLIRRGNRTGSGIGLWMREFTYW